MSNESNNNVFVPTEIKIARDINLISETENPVERAICVIQNPAEILIIEQMNQENYKRLMAFDEFMVFDIENLENAFNEYECDICNTPCDEKNPVYTNNEFAGVDICSNCIQKAFQKIKPLAETGTETVYSLREIRELRKNNE
jgi:hypothetical protein